MVYSSWVAIKYGEKWFKDRKVEVNQNSGKVVFNVYDKFGIGKADLEVIAGNWPKKVMIRCHFSGLEGFKLRILDKVYQKDELKIRVCNEKGESIKEKYLLHYENDMSKKSCPFLCSESLYKNGQDFLDK